MTEQNSNVTSPPDTEVVVEKKKFYRNPKVIGSAVLTALAAGAAAVFLGRSNSDSDDAPVEEDDLITEVFPPEDSV